jgi:hypothetical protein
VFSPGVQTEWAVWLAADTLESLTNRVMNTGFAASLIAMLVGLAIMASMFRSYKVLSLSASSSPISQHKLSWAATFSL